MTEEIKSIVAAILSEIIFRCSSPKKQIEETSPKKLTFMQRKLLLLQNETKEDFGSLSNMKKRYFKIEREKMKLKEEKENNALNGQNVIDNNEDRKERPEQLLLNKKTERECEESLPKENPSKECKEEEKHSGYTPIKRKKKTENNGFEDLGTMLSKARKIRPKIEVQKEKFINEQNVKKKQELEKNKNIIKSQVIKFEI